MLFRMIVAGAVVATAGLAHAETVPAVATTEPPALRDGRVLPPAGSRTSAAQKEANKRIVLQWHYEFFDLGQFDSAARKYMADRFQQYNKPEPTARADYVTSFMNNGYKPGPADQRPPFMTVLAQDDLVMLVMPGEKKPDGSWDLGTMHCDMYRLSDGKIVAMWVSGQTGRPRPQTDRQAGGPG